MDRSRSSRCAWNVVLLGLLAAAAGGGCNAISWIGYLTHEDNTPADFADFKGNGVAVVVRPVLQMEYADAAAAPDLAAVVGALLTQNIKHIHVVPPSEIAQWADENSWQEYTQVGKAVKADYVVGIHLERFSLYQGPTLYQGHAEVHLRVFDMHDGGRVVYDKPMPQLVFPPNSAVAASERPEADFRRQYIETIANRIARHFYKFDPSDDDVIDANFLNSPGSDF